jgi:hypothetical protein
MSYKLFMLNYLVPFVNTMLLLIFQVSTQISGSQPFSCASLPNRGIVSAPQDKVPLRVSPSQPSSFISWWQHYQSRFKASTIRSASRSPDLHACYLLQRFNWSSLVPNLISWKFIFFWLPTCERLHKYDKHKVMRARCPSCKVNSETHLTIWLVSQGLA